MDAAEADTQPIPIPGCKSDGTSTDSEVALTPNPNGTPPLSTSATDHGADTPTLGPTTPKSPGLSRNPSFSGSSSYQEDWEAFPPLDRLTVLDILDNFALPHQLEKLQKGISAQAEKVRKSREAIKNRSQKARTRMVEEWRRHVPDAEEQLDRYTKRMRKSVEKLGKQWNDTKVITLREKVSFIFGVMNIFISGYLLGGFPQYFHLWYTAQILYFMPIRFYTYHKRGYHYFLADLCYFANFLLILSLWIFPGSKRLFTAVYCLAFGNNAVAIIMWRNSLVFHSFDKVTSLFIHIMPCATLHCLVHLLSSEQLKIKHPAAWAIKNSPLGSPTAYANVWSMLAWSSIPYALWQLSYYFFITVRRREKIAAGRPTSFTWLRKSYSKVWIGRVVLSLPSSLQEPAFMLIQYAYAVLTMLPCPIWFHSRWASALFLLAVFGWSVYNGSTYYIDVFGNRFQKELEAMKAEVAKWQNSPNGSATSPVMAPHPPPTADSDGKQLGGAPSTVEDAPGRETLDSIPLLVDEDLASGAATGVDMDAGAKFIARERKVTAETALGT
ncbi:putative f-box protein [Phialemonium atrogriseum]|uniref:Glycerophosphocholine acyltransferase 1 n=1 Tax=Phialemonium atrogriseum TaxID=1093897 RepID=A0AAJ0C863_9PEZI|nr:putative f-box protein [Phialemonium atrogriseum]KAK1770497.1 putative f-box protein [Phialemonium atrogriseum]